MTFTVHQAVHGYAKGHVELATSTKLRSDDSDLLTRLSDLSGALLQDREFDSYLTLYPLPSTAFYVVARTWLDREAPRPGCVLTHSLLIPMEFWATCHLPHAFAELLNKPSPGTLDSVRHTLHSLPSVQSLPDVKSQTEALFVSRFFAEGLQPWCGLATLLRNSLRGA